MSGARLRMGRYGKGFKIILLIQKSFNAPKAFETQVGWDD